MTCFCGTEAHILLLGLDAAGKTTLLYKLKLNEATMTIRTIGFHVETISPINDVSFTMWDVCGQERVRPLWRHYQPNTDGLVFVVDIVGFVRFEEARSELEALLGDEDFQEVPVVLLANKQDLPRACPPLEVADKMGLRKLQGHRWHVQGCSALTGEGIPEAMWKLAEMLPPDLEEECTLHTLRSVSRCHPLTSVVDEQQPLHRPVPVELPGSVHHTLWPIVQGQVSGQAVHVECRAGGAQLALQLLQHGHRARHQQQHQARCGSQSPRGEASAARGD
ncbi:ADP-ribosylation factor 6-like [Lacerta agilis]|uniref:ADP-ribosylation factor 6-like n=1 Tax=Lacerta agilis TaxID=80427 RepID=UPI001419B726|nr:ADP-ribosylation factor 6-like [Lacerta agilis]